MRALALSVISVVLSLPGLAAAPVSAAPASAQDAAVQRVAAWPRLKVPTLGVDAAIIPVGITSRGLLAVGPSVTNVYTWKYGVRPGQRGSAVLAGHTWSRGHGVFDELGTMKVGQRFTVGSATFRVNKVQRVRRMSGAQVEGLFSDRGKPRVVLITCGDRTASGVYQTRILVYANKV